MLSALKTLRSYLILATAALALLIPAGAASASPTQEMDAAFRKYGLPIKAKLSRMKIGDETHELDLSSPLTRQGADRAIGDYLLRHAADELHVISMLVGEPRSGRPHHSLT